MATHTAPGSDSTLRGRVIVLTGASSGNGRATAAAFAREGAQLMLAARRAELLAEVANECEAFGGRAVAVATDVTDAAQVEALGEQAFTTFGGIDVWINNAGVIQFGRLDETPVPVLRRVIETNLLGCMHGAQVALRHFRGRGRGILINVGSILGVVGQPFAAAYAASKFAVRGLGEALRQETSDQPDIHVCTLLPAAIDTPIYRNGANYTGHQVGPPPPVYTSGVVAEAMLALVRNPRREAYAGEVGALVARQKAMAPGLTEWITDVIVRHTEVGDLPAAPTEGNLFQPADDRGDVRDGWK